MALAIIVWPKLVMPVVPVTCSVSVIDALCARPSAWSAGAVAALVVTGAAHATAIRHAAATDVTAKVKSLRCIYPFLHAKICVREASALTIEEASERGNDTFVNNFNNRQTYSSMLE